MDKNRQIISELKDFFKHNDSSKAVNAVNRVMERLVIQAKTVGPVKNPNCKFTFVQLVKLLVLHPFFSVKTPADYADSALGKLFSCKKDSFYRLMDDGRIDWRRLVHSIVHSYDIDPHSYDVDPLEEGRAFKEQSLFARKQAAA